MATGEHLQDEAQALARRLAEEFQVYSFVEAVTLVGSRTSGIETDACSDIDLCLYSDDGTFPLAERQAIIARLGGVSRTSLGQPSGGMAMCGSMRSRDSRWRTEFLFMKPVSVQRAVKR